MSNTDPFSQVYQAVWHALNGYKPLADLISLGNKIRFDGVSADSPEKKQAQDADMPELILAPAGLQITPFATSSSSQAIQSLDLLMSTGDLRIGDIGSLYPLTWAIFCALAMAGTTLGLECVKRFEIETFSQVPDDSDANRGMAGWTSAAKINVELYFANDQAGQSRAIQE